MSTYTDFIERHATEVRSLLSKLRKIDPLKITDEQYSKLERKLSVYDPNVESSIEHWLFTQSVDVNDVYTLAADNLNKYGTETSQIVNALKDFLSVLDVE